MVYVTRKRLGIAAVVLSASVGVAVAIPAIVSAQCNYGSCAIPPGFCPNGSCNSLTETEAVYYDNDCDGAQCQHDICFFYERLSNGDCFVTSNAICYSGDRHYCNGVGCTNSARNNCAQSGGTFNESDCTCYMSPILINLTGNSRNDHLTSAADGVIFDIAATGLRTQLAWPREASDVGFLAIDNNENGVIDNGAELFGTATRKSDGTVAANGFEALAEFDDNGDGRIDAGDSIFPKLLIWVDRNHNGLSETSEFEPAARTGLSAILTTYRESPLTDRYGNAYRYQGTALMVQGRAIVERRIFDVFLATQ